MTHTSAITTATLSLARVTNNIPCCTAPTLPPHHLNTTISTWPAPLQPPLTFLHNSHPYVAAKQATIINFRFVCNTYMYSDKAQYPSSMWNCKLHYQQHLHIYFPHFQTHTSQAIHITNAKLHAPVTALLTAAHPSVTFAPPHTYQLSMQKPWTASYITSSVFAEPIKHALPGCIYFGTMPTLGCSVWKKTSEVCSPHDHKQCHRDRQCYMQCNRKNLPVAHQHSFAQHCCNSMACADRLLGIITIYDHATTTHLLRTLPLLHDPDFAQLLLLTAPVTAAALRESSPHPPHGSHCCPPRCQPALRQRHHHHHRQRHGS